MTQDLSWARRLTWLAVFGAALGAVGDTLLLYVPTGGYEDPNMAFMASIEGDRLLAGHLLGILGIPLHAGGLWLVWHVLQPAGRKMANLAVALGVYVVAIGTAVHALFFPIAEAARTSPEAVAAAKAFLDPIAGLFVLGFFSLFVVVIILILRGKTTLPKWAAWGTPISIYLLSVLMYLLVPAIGNVMLPAGFNLGMMFFFLLLLFVGPRNTSQPS